MYYYNGIIFSNIYTGNDRLESKIITQMKLKMIEAKNKNSNLCIERKKIWPV